MISIIIPSRSAEALKSISQNIAKTIGVPFEIIDYNNSDDGFGICKIYNLCAQKAKYENLVFCHDDIIFHSSNWGHDLISLIDVKGIGLVGIAGATFKSKYPLSWVSVNSKYYRSNAFYENSLPKEKNITDSKYSEVAVVDGMFLGMKRDTWLKYKFNEDELKKFHLYDIDISYRILKEKKVVVSNQIIVEHKSRGNFDVNWFKESIKWHENKKLPVYIKEFDLNQIDVIENESQKLYINQLINFGFKTSEWPKEFISLCKTNKKIYFGILYKMLKKYISKTKFLLNKKTAPYRKTTLDWILRKRVHNSNICLVSNNCWAGDIYEVTSNKYNTPFIGLFINAPCYIKFLNDFNYYINLELKFKETSKYDIQNIKYPIGVLDDVEIHFLHYKTKAEAYGKWNRRKERMPKDINSYIFKMDDRDFASKQEIEDFHALGFPKKISFTKEKYNYKDNIKLKNKEDLILLYTTYALTDFSKLLNDGKVENSFFNKIISKLIKYPSKWL